MMPRRDVRPAAVAGTWYPSNEAQLEAVLDVHLAAVASASQSPCPRALIAPHAGLARIFDWSGRPGPAEDYAQVVGIYDPESHVVTQLMHVRALPDAPALDLRRVPLPVKAHPAAVGIARRAQRVDSQV